MTRRELASEVTRRAHAKGGRSKAKQVTVAQASELLRLTFLVLAEQPAAALATLLRR